MIVESRPESDAVGRRRMTGADGITLHSLDLQTTRRLSIMLGIIFSGSASGGTSTEWQVRSPLRSVTRQESAVRPPAIWDGRWCQDSDSQSGPALEFPKGRSPAVGGRLARNRTDARAPAPGVYVFAMPGSVRVSRRLGWHGKKR